MAELPAIDMAYDCDVYEPAEDTFLLVDALQDELPQLGAQEPAICVEIGCGSGAVFVYLATQLQKLKSSTMFIATDINPLAASVAQQTATNNGVQAFDVVRTDLLQCFASRIQGKVDVLLFNPPYVPTPSEEVGSRGIEAAWAGGLHGREVIDRLLPKLNELLSPRGVFYMVVVAENKPNEIAAALAKDGFDMTVRRTLVLHKLVMSFVLRKPRMSGCRFSNLREIRHSIDTPRSS